MPGQLIDRTRGRPSTFFGDGLVAHIAFGDPFCHDLRAVLATATDETGATVHRGGTYIVMEGPAFSTRAESHLYRNWGADGMTALPWEPPGGGDYMPSWPVPLTTLLARHPRGRPLT
jgi:5'-methylthioadenosine phosphorylase